MNICRSQDGHVKLYHKLMDSDLSQDNNALLVFVKMLFMAHWKDDFAAVRFGGKQTKLKAGEFSATMSELAEHTHMPISTLRKVIDRLESDNRISKRTDRQKSIFTICNWSVYQGDKSHDRANEVANDRANGMANDVANVTEGQKKLKKVKKVNIDTNVSRELAVRKQISLDIDEAFREWEQIHGYEITGKMQLNRNAASNLIKKFGLETVKQHIYAANVANHDQYARFTVADFTDLQSKQNSLKLYSKTSGKKINVNKAMRAGVA